MADNAALLAAHSSRSRDTSIREEPRHRRKPLKPDTSRRRHSTHVGRSPRPTNYVSTESPSYSRTLQPYYTHESSESFTHSHNTTRGYIDATGDERTGHDLDSIGNQYPQPAVENDGTTSSDFQPPEDNDEDVKSQTDSSERSSVSDQSLALLSPEELQLRLHQLRKKLDSIDDKALIDQVEHHMKDKDDRLSRAAMSLMKIRDANTDTKSDEHFNNSVQRLRHIIKYWSMSQKLGKSSETDTSRRSANSWWPRTPTNSSNYNVQKLKIVMPYYDYTKSPRGFSNLVQACIWDFLARKLFGFHNWDGNGKLGRLKRAYADFKDNLQHGIERGSPQSEQFHKWRVMTAQLMDMSPSGIREAAKQVAKKASVDLGFLQKDEINSDLIDIMQQALELDADFAKQKAYFEFDPDIQYNSPFIPEIMEDVGDLEIGATGGGSYRKVDLLLAPPLYKRGDSEGRNYHYKRLAMKGEVFCR